MKNSREVYLVYKTGKKDYLRVVLFGMGFSIAARCAFSFMAIRVSKITLTGTGSMWLTLASFITYSSTSVLRWLSWTGIPLSCLIAAIFPAKLCRCTMRRMISSSIRVISARTSSIVIGKYIAGKRDKRDDTGFVCLYAKTLIG